MADNVFPQYNGGTDPDLLSESNLGGTIAALVGYQSTVADGLTLSANYADDTVTLSSGTAVIMASGGVAYVVQPDQRNNLSLPDSSGVNHVFVHIDTTADDDISVHIDGNNTAPTNPSIKIGTVDTANNNTTLLNRGGGSGGIDILDDDLGVVQSGAESIETQQNLTALGDPNNSDGVVFNATDTRVRIQNDGNELQSKPAKLNFLSGLSATTDGAGGVEVTATASGGGGGGFTDSGSVSLQAASTDNNVYDIPVYVQDGETVTVTEVGVSLEDSTTDANVSLKLLDPSGTSVGSVSIDTHPKYTTSPNMTYTNGTGSLQRIALQLINEGSNDYTPQSGNADYVEFATKWTVA